MVHAYNKGELHGSRSLRSRVAALAGRISDEDARHFAETPHAGLPERKEKRTEKQAQIMFRPDEVNALYGRLAPRLEDAVERASARSKRRRSFLGHVVSSTAKGAMWGTALGGLGAGALGVGLANGAADSASLPPDVLRDKLVEAGVRCGLFGAGRGALVGSLAGLGVGTLNAIRE